MLTVEFLNQLAERYEKTPTKTTKTYQIGPSKVEVKFCGLENTDFFTKALSHLEMFSPEFSDLTIFVADRHHSHLKLPYPTWQWEDVQANSLIPTYKPNDIVAAYFQVSAAFFVLHRSEKKAFYWVEDTESLPEWERSFPFRFLLHQYWRIQPHLMMIHGGAVGTEKGGVLLTGKGGSGKSTACLSCLDSFLKYAGDDIMLIDVKQNMIYSLYNVAKLEAHQIKQFSHLEPYIYNPEAIPAEKAQVFLHDYFPQTLINRMPLKAILMPKYTGKKDTTYELATAGEALRAIAPSTMELFLEEPEYVHRLASICKSVPTYKIFTGTDLEQIPHKIEEILNWN